jgi:hypothetical protein
LEVVLNLDGFGCSDYKDLSGKYAIVPISLKGEVIDDRINYVRKHVTVLICLAAAGGLLPDYVVITLKSRMNTWKGGKLIRHKQVVIVESVKPYVNVSLFEDFVTRVFCRILKIPCRNPVLVTKSWPIDGER